MTFLFEISFSVNKTCLFKLDNDTLSKSIRQSWPMPDDVKYVAVGQPIPLAQQ